MGFFKDLLSGGGHLYKKVAPKELRNLAPKEIQPGGFDPARDFAGFDATRNAITQAQGSAVPKRDPTRLYAPPPGGLTTHMPNGPMTGATLALNGTNANTRNLMNSTGGRTYTPNPFNSSQAPIRPPPAINPATPNMPIKPGMPMPSGPTKPPGMGVPNMGLGGPQSAPGLQMPPGGMQAMPMPNQPAPLGQQQQMIKLLRGRMMR